MLSTLGSPSTLGGNSFGSCCIVVVVACLSCLGLACLVSSRLGLACLVLFCLLFCFVLSYISLFCLLLNLLLLLWRHHSAVFLARSGLLGLGGLPGGGDLRGAGLWPRAGAQVPSARLGGLVLGLGD